MAAGKRCTAGGPLAAASTSATSIAAIAFGVERPEALAQHLRRGEGPLHRHLLVEREADEQRHRLSHQEPIGLVVAGEMEAVRLIACMARRVMALASSGESSSTVVAIRLPSADISPTMIPHRSRRASEHGCPAICDRRVRVASTTRGYGMRTLIKGGTIVNADATTPADVLVDGERIALIGSELGVEGRPHDRRERQVGHPRRDRRAHPHGAAVRRDVRQGHVRDRHARGGLRRHDDDHRLRGPGQGPGLREGLDAWHAKAEGRATIDYGFHMIMSDVTDETLAEMDTLVDEGVTDFKLFTAYPGVFFSDDGAIFRAMQQTAKNGGLILMHAENGLAIDVVAGAERRGRQHRSVLPRRQPLAGHGGRGHEPRHPPGAGGRRAGLHRPPVGDRRRSTRCAAPATRGCRPTPRPARSTCS